MNFSYQGSQIASTHYIDLNSHITYNINSYYNDITFPNGNALTTFSHFSVCHDLLIFVWLLHIVSIKIIYLKIKN